MGVILDTGVIINAEKGVWSIEEFIAGRQEEPFGLSVISVSELLHGVHRADTTPRRRKRSAFVEKVIELFPVYPFEMTAARIYAELWADLAARGIQIGAHDLIIGSTALTLGFSVATCNVRHFSRIDGLTLEHLR